MIAYHKGEIPVVILLLPFLLGISLGHNVPAGAGITALAIALFLLCTCFILLNLNYGRLKLYKARWLGGLLSTLILFIFGWLNVTSNNELKRSNHFSKTAAQYLVVNINNQPTLKNGLLRFTADVEQSISHKNKLATSGTLLITITDSAANLHYGDELLIPAKYNPIQPPLNPAEFNYKQYLANKNIFYQAYLYPKQFVVLKTGAGNPIIAYSLRLRQQLVEKFKRNMHNAGAIAVASTLILGYKADLSNDILQAYSKTGTVYVLSVSGAQVAIIYALLNFVFSFLNRYKHGSLIKVVIIIACIGYYAILTGCSLAVCRVAVMVSMVVIGKTMGRHINTLNLLAVSAFLLLLYNPFYITEVGFQLSYIAVAGIMVLQPVIYKWFTFKNKWAGKLWMFCSLSIAAQVVTLPISVLYFHQFAVYFLLSNLLVIVPAAVIMYAGVFYLLLPQVPFVSATIAFILEKQILLMNKALALIEHAPYASIDKIWLTLPEYLLLYTIITSLVYFLYNKKVWAVKLSLVCTLLLCLSWSIKSINLAKTNSITWLSLNKHQGVVFKNGNQAIVLADVKPADKTWQYAVQPYLDSCQISNVSVYGLTQQDIKTPWLMKKGGFIQFIDKTIFVFNGQLENARLPQKLKTDYIYITGNPGEALTAINNNFNYKTLIIDGSNSDNMINKIEQQAIAKHVNYKILKRNNSLISISN